MYFLKLFIILFVLDASAGETLTAIRDKHEDYRSRANKFLSLIRPKNENSAYSLKSTQIDIGAIEDWSGADMQKAFEWVRDERFLVTEDNFNRRSSWLYPPDGCFVRAELAGQRLVQKKYPNPSKIFVFGNLSVDTENVPDGSVSWWFHVVVGYKKNGVVYVFDPAIEPKRPLTLDEWSSYMGTETKEFAVCDMGTYAPSDKCHNPSKMTFEKAKDAQQRFLSYEWENLESLGRDPVQELGENPPWHIEGVNNEYSDEP